MVEASTRWRDGVSKSSPSPDQIAQRRGGDGTGRSIADDRAYSLTPAPMQTTSQWRVQPGYRAQRESCTQDMVRCRVVSAPGMNMGEQGQNGSERE